MLRKFIYLCICFISSVTIAQQNALLFTQANEAYNKGDYQNAVNQYKKIEETGNVSANLYYNIANSYYKLQQVAPSIYYYEKALSLNPNETDVLNNYQFAKNTRIDKIDALPTGFLARSYSYLIHLFKTDVWAWIAVIFIFLFVATFILFYKTADSIQRKLFFGAWSLSAILALFSLLFAFQTERFKKDNAFAIIFSKEVNIQSEPNLRSETLFKLHEGTKVQLMDNVEEWNKIKLSDGKIGWMPAKELKQI